MTTVRKANPLELSLVCFGVSLRAVSVREGPIIDLIGVRVDVASFWAGPHDAAAELRFSHLENTLIGSHCPVGPHKDRPEPARDLHPRVPA